jgi:hypothetical protein
MTLARICRRLPSFIAKYCPGQYANPREGNGESRIPPGERGTDQFPEIDINQEKCNLYKGKKRKKEKKRKIDVTTRAMMGLRHSSFH